MGVAIVSDYDGYPSRLHDVPLFSEGEVVVGPSPERGSLMRILLADHESNVRYGLRVLLEERPEFEVEGEAADAEELLAQIEAACPDLVLLSWGLPGPAGTDLLLALRSVCDDLYVIVLSGRSEARQAILDAGANAFVSKVEPPERLLAAIASAERCNRKGG